MEALLKLIPWDIVGWGVSAVLSYLLNKYIKKDRVNKYLPPTVEVLTSVIKNLPKKISDDVKGEVKKAIKESSIRGEIEKEIRKARSAPWL